MFCYTGTIVPWPSADIPKGWLICDGTAISATEYAALYQIIGNIYGGDSSLFNLPDLKGRTVVGVGQRNHLRAYALGDIGGEEGVSITEAEMPLHSHYIRGNKNTGVQKTASPEGNVLGIPDDDVNMYVQINSLDTKLHESTLAVSGSSVPHDNMQPYTVVNYIICYDGETPKKN